MTKTLNFVWNYLVASKRVLSNFKGLLNFNNTNFCDGGQIIWNRLYVIYDCCGIAAKHGYDFIVPLRAYTISTHNFIARNLFFMWFDMEVIV